MQYSTFALLDPLRRMAKQPLWYSQELPFSDRIKCSKQSKQLQEVQAAKISSWQDRFEQVWTPVSNLGTAASHVVSPVAASWM